MHIVRFCFKNEFGWNLIQNTRISRHENVVRNDGHFLSKTICPHISCRLVLHVIVSISPWCHYYQVFTDTLRHNMCRNDRFLCEACKITSNCLRNRQDLYTCMAYLKCVGLHLALYACEIWPHFFASWAKLFKSIRFCMILIMHPNGLKVAEVIRSSS